MSLSIIIPCFNEEKNILKVLNNLILNIKKYTYNYEIIVIDDFSKDKTYKTVKLFKKKNRILLYRNRRNLGYGGSFKKGLSKSNKNYVIVATGDGETNFENMLKYYYLTKKFDIVCTYPVGNDRGFIRNFLSSSFTKILNFFFNLNLKYYNGATYYKKENLSKILIDSDGFFFNAEILIKLIKKKKLKFIQKPMKMKKRNEGTSNAIKMNVFINVLFDFIKTRICI